MQNELSNVMNAWNQTTFKAATQLAQIQAKAFEKMARKQIEFCSNMLDYGHKQVDLARNFKDLNQHTAEQNALVHDYAGRHLSAVSETLDLLSKTRDELNTWFEQGVSEVTTQQVAAVAPKKAA
jgi:ubiquitin C-terminal hydrolase